MILFPASTSLSVEQFLAGLHNSPKFACDEGAELASSYSNSPDTLEASAMVSQAAELLSRNQHENANSAPITIILLEGLPRACLSIFQINLLRPKYCFHNYYHIIIIFYYL